MLITQPLHLICELEQEIHHDDAYRAVIHLPGSITSLACSRYRWRILQSGEHGNAVTCHLCLADADAAAHTFHLVEAM